VNAPSKRSSPESLSKDSQLELRIERDGRAAQAIPAAASEQLRSHLVFTPAPTMARGVAEAETRIARGLEEVARALQAVAQHPFHAMLEGEVANKNNAKPIEILWYVHEMTRATVTLEMGGQQIKIVSWTHPAYQVGRSADLGDWEEIPNSEYAIRAVRPSARAWFTQLVPELAAVYEPGGVVSAVAKPEAQTGLKAIKLDMTPDQVKAFIARMSGFLMVTGAPGTGKTTVAFQRIRFLFDQQGLRETGGLPHRPALTRVFLASRNLINYSKKLLKDELEIPPEVVSYVPAFIRDYVADMWRVTNGARPIQRQMDPATIRAREAMLNLCPVRDLEGLWARLEAQVRDRLAGALTANWIDIANDESQEAGALAKELAEDLATVPVRQNRQLLDSDARMDALWLRVRKPYDDCRKALKGQKRDRFDDAFAAWLYWVFDPLDALRSYFEKQERACLQRIKNGTGEIQVGPKVFKEVIDDWRRRLYGGAELGWIAWILRFVLPERAVVEDGFRVVPRALPQPDDRDERRWTHVVIDEAQDLSVQEASLLASFVDPSGALTVSADFHQVVSPVHGMTSAEALKMGLPIVDRKLHMQFPFKRNLRQAREIGQFLRGFHQAAFGEAPSFDAGDKLEGEKPHLLIGPRGQFPLQVKQLTNVLRRVGTARSVAVLFVHDDQAALSNMRNRLAEAGVGVAEPEDLLDRSRVVVATVEQAKGLEFDVCVVIGLDDVERAALNFAKNRAYVALSRPTHKLVLLCEHDPAILHGVTRTLYERRVFA
jgi:hypothetical protein